MEILLKRFKEFGLWGMIKLTLLSILYKKNIKLPMKSITKIYIKEFKDFFYIRPYTSDITLISGMFCNKVDGRHEYELEWNENIKYIIDAGANIGIFCVMYAIKFPKAKIVAIEAELGNYNLLKKNILKYPNIIAIHAGVWNKNTYLSVKARETGNWGFIVEECYGETKNSILGLSIEEIINNNNIPKIDILKMDIEGSEYEVFSENYKTWLEKTQYIIIETHERFKSGSEQKVSEVMMENGYSLKYSGENKVYYKTFDL